MLACGPDVAEPYFMTTILPNRIYGTGQKVILSVEDESIAYRLLEICFSEVGGDFSLYRVMDGDEALEFLRRHGRYVDAPRPNLILLNLNMPRVSGFEVLEAMKDDPAISDIPAVVFTTSTLDREKARCLALGAKAFVTKPSAFGEFQHVLHDVCSLL
jgi:CheY-like chemotaxis protein